MITTYTYIFLLAMAQTTAFAMSSRAKNRGHMGYNLFATVACNLVWFLTFRELVKSDMSLDLLLPYVLGCSIGALIGAKASMRIEKKIEASADGHLGE